jgi:hypothetical protein
MGLGLQTESGGGGDFADLIKYDARAGRMFRVDRTQGANGWETNNVEITPGFTFVPDLDNILVGWALFAAGVAPQFSMAPLGDPMPQKPSDQYKQGFKLMSKLGKNSGGDVRELASCAKTVIGAISTLHDEFTAGRAANPGKLPVVALTGSTPVVSTGQGKSSTNYAPIFEITKWVDRPAELVGGVPANEPKAEPVAQLKTTSQVAAAPAPADDEEF